MTRRIAAWASAGFLVACGWVLYTFAAPPEQLLPTLREPVVKALLFTSCPIAFAGRYLPLHFWWVPPINAATYAVIGLILEGLRRKSHRALAI